MISFFFLILKFKDKSNDGRFFGQLLIFHAISKSDEPRLRATLPLGWERWYDEMVEFLDYCAAYSPAISRDMDLVRLL